ncbi:MAG: diphosphomevalonate decarboxylase [Saprospiraceae bacterium]|nr:diphosphomevalonate decarboxylase [Saprospiraceae bacterium]
MSNSTEMPSNPIKAGWESPSNIALIKYWGKHGKQLPRNSSVSFTLSTAATRTFVTIKDENRTGKVELDFIFNGKENPAFSARVENFLNSICDEYFTFLKKYSIHIDTSNSFPHSSGIASSASGMSALALCLCDIENQLNDKTNFDENFCLKASEVSRLGSGSACRSIYPEVAVWGQHEDIPGSSDEYAIGIRHQIHPVFKSFHDDILIISAGEKSVSSTAGHNLMEGNPFAPVRYQQANQRMKLLITALKQGNISDFGKIAEDEAMTLHALMMCSDPSYILMEEGTLSVIRKIKQFREQTSIPVFFTLDAGPNVHVLYPDEGESQVNAFIQNELKPYCNEGRIIRDKVGTGPEKIS